MANFFKSVLASARAILQSKTVGPVLSETTYYPDTGYDGFSSVTVEPVEVDNVNNRATPTTMQQFITPSVQGEFFESFTVDPIPSQYKIPYSITPSDSAPASMSSGTAYEPDSAGYAIQSYVSTSKTPSSSGTSFNAGWNRMTAAGYAYSSRPSGQMSTTTLWTNSNTSASFTEQTITLSQSLNNFQYIRIAYNVRTSTSENVWEFYYRSDFQTCQGDTGPRMMIGGANYVRGVRYISATSIGFSKAFYLNSSSYGSNNSYVIPISVSGCNVT